MSGLSSLIIHETLESVFWQVFHVTTLIGNVCLASFNETRTCHSVESLPGCRTSEMGYDLTNAAEQARRFAIDRDWEQFHTLKNLAMALTGEVGELVEIFQWLDDEQINGLLETPEGRTRVEEEVADIAIYLLRIVQVIGINLSEAIASKFLLNESRYPVESARGSSAKYKG